VRLGTYQKADGTHVPMWHDSEVAAIAFALQNIIARRNQVADTAAVATPHSPAAPELVGMSSGLSSSVMAGKKCPECGAHAMIRKDGCDYCTSCGHLGSCG
jgi:ribonucleoside-diphosphate reductase alpha chain